MIDIQKKLEEIGPYVAAAVFVKHIIERQA